MKQSLSAVRTFFGTLVLLRLERVDVSFHSHLQRLFSAYRVKLRLIYQFIRDTWTMSDPIYLHTSMYRQDGRVDIRHASLVEVITVLMDQSFKTAILNLSIA